MSEDIIISYRCFSTVKMLKGLASYGLSAAEALDATYVEARAQQTNYELITIDSGVLKEFFENLLSRAGDKWCCTTAGSASRRQAI